jgi:basic membrane protein A
MYEARYLSGIVAGLKTRTGKIGYVSAMGKDNSEVTGGINAFALGVESVNPQARIQVRVTHSWFDPAAEVLAARSLIAEGHDVIAQHCNNSGPQAEAGKSGVWGIGFNSDMRGDAPEAVLTSVIWRWGVYYTFLVRSLMDGSFTTRPYFGGIREGIVAITPLNENLAPPGAVEAVEAARGRIVSGELAIFSGVLETNDGRRIGSAGSSLSDGEIIGGINWYYRTVRER